MDHLSAIRTFIEIADRGSLTRAAETLDLSRAMVSRHLEGLERWLGARLLHRTTRRVSLSEAGQEALPRLRQMLELAADLQAVAGARRTEPTGKLRITTSLSFAFRASRRRSWTFRAAPAHRGRTPDRGPGGRPGRRTDRPGRSHHQSPGRRRGGAPARELPLGALCVAGLPEAARPPEHPEDLKSHDCITHAFGTRAEYRLGQAGGWTLGVTGPLSGNETAVLRQAALAGAGIAMLPTYFVGDELMRGALVRLLPDHEPEPLGIHAVYLSRQHQPRR